MPSYRLSRRAAVDLEENLTYTIDRWGVSQADRYFDNFEALFETLSARPMLGRSATYVLDNLRRIEHESHVVFYKTLPKGIWIVRVLHKRRVLKKSDLR